MLSHKNRPEYRRCHSYLRNGKWEFLENCAHDMAGQVVDMVPYPDSPARRPEVDDE